MEEEPEPQKKKPVLSAVYRCVLCKIHLHTIKKKNLSIALFKFPRPDSVQCQKWLEVGESVKWPVKIGPVDGVCSQHFYSGRPSIVVGHPDFVPKLELVSKVSQQPVQTPTANAAKPKLPSIFRDEEELTEPSKSVKLAPVKNKNVEKRMTRSATKKIKIEKETESNTNEEIRPEEPIKSERSEIDTADVGSKSPEATEPTADNSSTPAPSATEESPIPLAQIKTEPLDFDEENATSLFTEPDFEGSIVPSIRVEVEEEDEDEMEMENDEEEDIHDPPFTIYGDPPWKPCVMGVCSYCVWRGQSCPKSKVLRVNDEQSKHWRGLYPYHFPMGSFLCKKHFSLSSWDRNGELRHGAAPSRYMNWPVRNHEKEFKRKDGKTLTPSLHIIKRVPHPRFDHNKKKMAAPKKKTEKEPAERRSSPTPVKATVTSKKTEKALELVKNRLIRCQDSQLLKLCNFCAICGHKVDKSTIEFKAGLAIYNGRFIRYKCVKGHRFGWNSATVELEEEQRASKEGEQTGEYISFSTMNDF